jgi:alanine dehydrogenase
MQLGIARETRAGEHRVGLDPAGVKALIGAGARVWVESGAGAAAGYRDTEYQSAGASTVFSRAEVYGRSDLVLAVYPPAGEEIELLRPDQVVLAFWALPTAQREVFHALAASGVTAIGHEIIENDYREAPVLTAMSEIAGRLAVTIGSGLLLREFGGRGILFAGIPGVPPASFVVLGAGVLGRAAAQAALGMGAHVVLLDRSVERLRYACEHLGRAVPTMLATRPNIERALSFADLVLAAVAVRAERAPVLVTREMLRVMKPHSVVMDLSIDMGGCFETSRPTAFPHPTYEVDGILHLCVPNLPSVAARSASVALTNALLPYLMTMENRGFDGALADSRDLQRGVYLLGGRCCKASLASAFGVEHQVPPGWRV